MKLQDICVTLGDRRVLDHFSLTLPHGETTCLTGPSGCGKTTVLRVVMGLIAPERGAVVGFDAQRIAPVFQEDRLIDHLSARDNLRLVCKRNVSDETLDMHLNALDLLPLGNAPVGRMSGGQRRRVAILRALAVAPTLLLLDEPFTGLDEAMRARAARYVRDTAREATVLLVTHDMDEAVLMATKNTIIMPTAQL